MVDMDIRVLNHLKRALAWAADKRLWVIGTIMNSYSTKELK